MRKELMLAGIIVATPLFAGAAKLEQARAGNRALADFSGAVEELANRCSSAVVQISVRGRKRVEDETPQQAGYVAQRDTKGSGVIVDAAGYILTNAHVVQGARSIDVSVAEAAAPAGSDAHKHYSATVVGVDSDTDLAVLKIPAAGLPALAFADSGSLKQGQIVLALGSPLGLENSLSVGFVSAPVRYLRPDNPMFYVQTDAPINPGNSGGPLLDLEGRVAGINTLILTQSGGSEGIGLAVPSNTARGVYERLRAEGRIRRGSIGVISQDITQVMASALGLQHHEGVIITDIRPHGAAEAAGLQANDIVLSIDGAPVKEARQVMAAVFSRPAGSEIVLQILRGQERLRKNVTVMERRESPAALSELASQSGQLIRSLGILALTVDDKVTATLPDLRRLSGVAVGGIPSEYAAINPGLAAGDVIYEMNGKPVTSIEDLTRQLAAKAAGDPVALLVERDGTLSYVPFEYE